MYESLEHHDDEQVYIQMSVICDKNKCMNQNDKYNTMMISWGSSHEAAITNAYL